MSFYGVSLLNLPWSGAT